MKEIYEIIEELASESSTNQKLEILKENKDNELFKKILVYSYDPLRNYYIKRYMETKEVSSTPESIESIFEVLDELSSRSVTGTEAREKLEELSFSLGFENRSILKKIINRDLSCGISAKSINKVFKDLIHEIPYMRCKTYADIKNIKFPCISQKKEDGLFVNIVLNKSKISFYTRNGNEFYAEHLEDELNSIFYENNVNDIVIHGELIVFDGDRELPRKVGNGKINSFVKREETKETLIQKIEEKKKSFHSYEKLSSELLSKLKEWESIDNNIGIIIWDCIPYKDWVNGTFKIPYSERFKDLKKFSSGRIKIVETQSCENMEELLSHYNTQIANGFEGVIAKNLSGIWKNHTSPDCVKIKSEKDCDLKCIGILEGNGKYTGKIGSLVCSSSDGKLLVNVGSGLTDADRDKDFSEFVGKIIAVKFNEVIDSESKDTHSLFLPRFMNVRIDKDVADSFETIKKI